MANPYASDHDAKIEEKSVRAKLLALKKRNGGLYIPTPDWGIVDAGSTSILYGEGPNIVGFRLAHGSFAEEHCASRKEVEAADSPRPADCMSLWEHAHDWAQEQAGR